MNKYNHCHLLTNTTSLNEKEFEECAKFLYHCFKRNTSHFRFLRAETSTYKQDNDMMTVCFQTSKFNLANVEKHIVNDDWILHSIEITPFSNVRLNIYLQILKEGN